MDCDRWGDYTRYKTVVRGTYVNDDIDGLPTDYLIFELIHKWRSWAGEIR